MTSLQRLAVRASAVRQKLWRSAGPLYNLAVREGLGRTFPPARTQRTSAARHARIVGLLSTATGIGQSARLCAEDLGDDGYTVSTFNLSPMLGLDNGVPFERGTVAPDARAGLSVFHCNPPLIMLAMLAAGVRRYYRSVNVAYWAWELPELPPEWLVALRYVDAVMVPSTFCRDIVARHSDKPVIVVPHPVRVVAAVGEVPPRHRPGQPFRVLTIFNCGSSLFRKNPVGLIDAFKLAFGSDSGAELVLKVADGRQHKADLALLRSRIGAAPNIRIVDAYMPPTELDALIRSADVYASLHRSEGFGLTVAEAIMREVPVVVTGWSGTTDFCPPELAHTVEHRLVPVEDPHPAYCSVANAVWAEPSVEAAARHLVDVRNGPAEARRRAASLRRLLVDHIAANRYASALDSLRLGRLPAPVAGGGGRP